MNVISSSAVSSLGLSISDHWRAVVTGNTGIKRYAGDTFSKIPFFASKLDPSQWQYIQAQTKSKTLLYPFEQLALFSVKEALRNCDREISLNETGFILSTTKGNIEWLGQIADERLLLHMSAGIIAKELGIKNKPVVISHACASGAIALIYGARLLQTKKFRHVIVVGCDRFSKFVLNGFQSFQAVADEPCKPFDANRKGINLGEAAATIILSSDGNYEAIGQFAGGSTSNDANHISGPSRTGEELAMAISKAMGEAGITNREIDMVGAHGTATVYNDEMETKAFGLSGLAQTPLHSFKGYAGHTLGAAGVLESAMILEAMRHQCLIPSAGFAEGETPRVLNLTTALTPATIHYALKTASGFGGCNAAIVWKKG